MFRIIQSGYTRTASMLLAFGLLVCISFAAGSLLPYAARAGFGMVGLGVAALLVLALFLMHMGRLALRKRLLLLLWIILFAEALFSRWEASNTALAENFSGAAYSEALVWLIVLVGLLLAAGTRRDLYRRLLSTPYIWVTLFGVLCVIRFSSPLLMSIAWAVKLWDVILILVLYAIESRGAEDMVALLKTILGGLVVLAVWPIVHGLTQARMPFLEGGRISADAAAAHPVTISGRAALVLLLALTLHSVDRRKLMLVVAGLGAIIMFFAAGKTAIIAALVSVIVMFALQRRIAALVGAATATCIIAILVLAFTPVSNYFADYLDAGYAGTLTGRVDVWQAALPRIREAPLLGHGYLASKFITEQLHLDFEAGHLHNAVLDVAYNLGVTGVVLVLAMFLCVAVNLIAVMRRTARSPVRLLVAALFAIFINILINGVTEVEIGGRAGPSFVLFLSVLAITDTLHQQGTRGHLNRYSIAPDCYPCSAAPLQHSSRAPQRHSARTTWNSITL